ncbi:ARM repeat-containing protein [Setomelanomma holmii]|uniref:ARM repeat-containing protein n=1 Tax=Setomelanomma holmii TaxID=210430 RepID=A0A9P4HG80_9PLEO|nr:ARM repeat-containing protein [Setomelanomma holmii]
MGRSTIPPALIELSNPSTPEAQVAALQSLKNEIVGHEQRKELAVTHGVIKPLAGLLRSEARKGGKRRRSQANGNGSGLFTESRRSLSEWSTEDELRFQATLVVGSLANGGPAFVAPMLAGNILPPLLEALRPSEAPAKLVTTTLKTLNQIVDAVAQEKPWVDMSETSSRSTLAFALREQLYVRPVIESLAEILSQPAGTMKANLQISLAVQLIMKTCQEENQKRMMVEYGNLDLLAGQLAAIAAADESTQDPDAKPATRDQLPRPCLSDVLEAIAAIIKDSHFYAARFLYSQPIQQLFGWPKDRATASYDGYGGTSQSSWDKLIPRVQTMTSKSDSYTKSWPALGSYTAANVENYGRLPSVESLQQPTGRGIITDESESPLFVWLMYVARRGEGRERLSACWLLALLKKFGERWPLNDPSKTTRERHFSYLIIPLVVKMIEESSPTSDHAKKAYAAGPAAKEEMRTVLERSPLVLAELVSSNKALQSAAVDARIMPTLVQILKRSFDTVTTNTKPLWQPKSSSYEVKDPMVDPASSTLGRSGLSADVLHAFKYRESVLLALAALAGDQDGLRKLVIEMGAATHIIEAMVPYSENNEPGAAPTSAKDGNPEPVLIAACKVTRSLSRSVSVLRTSLIDHGVAQPVYELLMHPSVKVQIAATEVITNLVLEMSPMRPEIIEAGVLRALCEQCRSANFNLRFGSLWALKHLCLGLPQDMKKQCLDELGVGWLVQVLNGEPSKPAMGTPNAAGEQVDLLNSVDEPHMDLDEDLSDEEDEDTMADSIPSMSRLQRPGSRYTSATNIRDRLQHIKNDEQDARINDERNEIRIQEQALDFLRNFISEDQTTGEMIDHLLKAFGHTRFFELLDAKIRPKNSSASTSSQPQPQPSTVAPTYWSNTAQRAATNLAAQQLSQHINWTNYPAAELVLATTFVLVHLANGRPAHRSLLISQTSLMQHVLPLCTHHRREVRALCAWFLNNLLWLEDSSDEAATRERAHLLRNLGFEEGAKLLAKDMDLDVRERVKPVIDQFARLLGEGHTGMGMGRSGTYGSASGQGFGGSEGGGMSGLGRLGGLSGWDRGSRG